VANSGSGWLIVHHPFRSGSAANLEIALALARNNLRPKNKVTFAFWGAEELGLLGSIYYVENLTDDEKDNIALNLNFDMIASPNYVRGVYNGSMVSSISPPSAEHFDNRQMRRSEHNVKPSNKYLRKDSCKLYQYGANVYVVHVAVRRK